MSYVEIETGRYVKRWAFWNPATWSIPKLYWDAWSQEQRLHAICRQLEKVIKYADYLGVNVDDIAARLKAIEEGQLNDFIVAAIEAWFEENQPEIAQAIEELQTDVENITLEIGDGFDAENTIEDAIANIESKIANDKEAVKTYVLPECNFKIADRFIYGDYSAGMSGQSCAVFKRGAFLYAAQVVEENYSTPYLIIRDMSNNATISTTQMQIGHGLSLSEKNEKLLISDGVNVLVINIEDLESPYIETTYNNLNLENVCWYKENAISIEALGDNLVLTEYAADFSNVIDTYTVRTTSVRGEIVIQNISYDEYLDVFIIGTTRPDGFLVIDTEKQLDFRKCENFYGHVYCRELETAYSFEKSIYTSIFDIVDGKLLIAIMEWDYEKGTIPDEESTNLFSGTSLFPSFNVNAETGSLIQPLDVNEPDANNFALIGDVINLIRSTGNRAVPLIHLKSDYDKMIVNDTSIVLYADIPLTMHSMYIRNSTVRLESAANFEFSGSQTVSATVKPAIYAVDGTFIFPTDACPALSADNTTATILFYMQHVLLYASRMTVGTVPSGSIVDSVALSNHLENVSKAYSHVLAAGS